MQEHHTCTICGGRGEINVIASYSGRTGRFPCEACGGSGVLPRPAPGYLRFEPQRPIGERWQPATDRKG